MKHALILLWFVGALLTIAGCTQTKAYEEIVYTRTGGIAAFDQRLSITAGGTYQLTEKGQPGKNGKLSASERKVLDGLVGAVKWAALKPEYTDPKVADAIFQGVTVTVGKQTHRTAVGTGAAPPAELAAVLAKLGEIFAAHR